MNEDFCKGCNVPIYWIRTKRGQNMPVERRKVTICTASGQVIQGYVCHWGTCPDRDRFKKKKPENALSASH